MPKQITCAANDIGVGERITRILIAVVVGAAAVSLIPSEPIIAAVFGIMAIALGWLAFAGATCPIDWLRARRGAKTENAGYPDASRLVELVPTKQKDKRQTHVNQ